MDTAHLYRERDASELRRLLAALRSEVAVTAVVATVPSLEGEPIEQYAIALAEAWQLGRRGEDDGLLILVAQAERAVRVEVGYGLEGVLPDAVCRRSIESALAGRAEMDFAATRALVLDLGERLRRELPRAERRPAHPTIALDPAVGSLVLVGLAVAIAGWLTLGRHYWSRQPFRPVRPPPGSRQVGERGFAGTRRHSLLYSILFGWLLGGGAGRGRRQGRPDDDEPSGPAGGGGRFGGGGAGGGW